MHTESKSGEAPAKQKGGGTLVESIARADPIKSLREENPPSYGEQHRQDALWKGGNEALPPRWRLVYVGMRDGYQNDDLFIVSWKRPLPGVRLDDPGYLVVPNCEWHISPLGRSYFVNHNTRTTSWKKPTPDHPPGSLKPKYIIERHSRVIWSLAYGGSRGNVISGSDDGSIHQWTRDGKLIGQPWKTEGGSVMSVAMSPDETMVISGSVDVRIRLWDIQEGRMVGDPWEGHNGSVRCLDWSPNGLEVASGSQDATIRRWNPATGRQIAPPIEMGQNWFLTIKYSPQGDKFVSNMLDGIGVWSKDGKLLIKIKGHDDIVRSLCWSKDGAYIFSGSTDSNIRKWRLIDGQELVVLRGHTHEIMCLCLSPDERHLLTASRDCSVRIWNIQVETNQLVGEPLLHDDELFALAISPDGKYVASGGLDKKISLWNLEGALNKKSARDGNAQFDAKLKQRMHSSQDILDVSTRPNYKKQLNKGRYGDAFWDIDTQSNTHDSAPLDRPSPRQRNLFDFLRFNRRAVDASPVVLRQPRRWNFRLSTVGISNHTAEVPTSRDDDRYGIAPLTEAEMAAMQAATANETNNLAQHNAPAAGVQGHEQGPSAQEGNSVDEASCVIGCCGFSIVFFPRRSQ